MEASVHKYFAGSKKNSQLCKLRAENLGLNMGTNEDTVVHSDVTNRNRVSSSYLENCGAQNE